MGGDISEADVHAAMKDIPGYIDITTGGFLEIYRVARDHARERLLGRLRADELMRSIACTLTPSMLLEDAIGLMSCHDSTLNPVVDSGGHVVGVLSDCDVLRHLGFETVSGLLAGLQEDPDGIRQRCRNICVAEVMMIPSATLRDNARYSEISEAFRAHGERCLPVVDEEGRLRGLLEHKDFVRPAVCGLDAFR